VLLLGIVYKRSMTSADGWKRLSARLMKCDAELLVAESAHPARSMCQNLQGAAISALLFQEHKEKILEAIHYQ